MVYVLITDMQIEKYKQREKHNITESTLDSRISALRKLDDFVDSEEITVEDVENWVDHLIEEFEEDDIKAGTIKQYFKAVKYYWKKIHGSADEIEHIRDWIPVGKTNHGDYLEREEWDALRNSIINLRDQAIIDLMYFYARRPGEVILLNLDDIDFEEETITFNILKKDDPFRATFKLRDEAKQSIENYLNYRTEKIIEGEHEWEDDRVEPLFTTNYGRISYDAVWRNIKSLAESAGINKNITPKSMRHSRVTHLDRSGEAPDVIARQQLIHDPDSNVVGHYVHPRDEEDVREVMSLDEE